MANNKNLKPFNERTESEQREIRSKGGKASGKKRRELKTMKENLKMLLAMPSEVREGLDIQTSGLIAMLENWENTGDKKIGEFIRDTIGEKPVNEHSITSGDISVTINRKSVEVE